MSAKKNKFLFLCFVGVVFSGCVTTFIPHDEKIILKDSENLYFDVDVGFELYDFSDCHLEFDLRDFPDTVGITLLESNPFDVVQNKSSKIALCPLKDVFSKTFNTSAEKVFFGIRGNANVMNVKVTPTLLSIEKKENFATCKSTLSIELNNEKISVINVEDDSLWEDMTTTPTCVYSVAAMASKQIFELLGQNKGKIKQRIDSNTLGEKPRIKTISFNSDEGSVFSGEGLYSSGSWSSANVLKFLQYQIGQMAISKLGIKSLENYRVFIELGDVNEGESGNSFRFKVYSYTGFEFTYNSQTLKGVCRTDIVFLGISANDAYNMSVEFIEKVLSDQGVVKVQGKESSPVKYRFNGYRTINNGGVIEIPFELIE